MTPFEHKLTRTSYVSHAVNNYLSLFYHCIDTGNHQRTLSNSLFRLTHSRNYSSHMFSCVMTPYSPLKTGNTLTFNREISLSLTNTHTH